MPLNQLDPQHLFDSLHLPSVQTFAGSAFSLCQEKISVSTQDHQSQWDFRSPEIQRCIIHELQTSSSKVVSVEPELGEEAIKFWANMGRESGKTVFLRLPAICDLPNQKKPLRWWLKRLTDWVAAAVILSLLSPALLMIALMITCLSPGPIFFRQWRVGENGKLFQIYKFRTMVVGAEKMHHLIMGQQAGLHKLTDDPRITPLGKWLRKYSLDELPQLLNVLRGEMSLVGPRPWALFDALRIKPEGQHRLNALPGITGAWQVQARSNLLDLEAVNHCDIQYLQSWSIVRDLKILLLTVPKVLSGFGAC
jgi:lipopolysaccharide/colanic/teichoic acid biosynthesis glycosyltransferase